MMNVILLAMDGSETPKLIDVTRDLLGQFSSAQLVTVYVSAPHRTAHSTHDSECEYAKKLLGMAKMHHFPHAAERIRMDHRFGEPWEEICKAAVEVNADLVVVGSHRVGVVEHIWPGSVSSAVVRHCQKPVLVVKEQSR